MKEKNVVDIALENLLAQTGIVSEWKIYEHDEVDGKLHMTIDHNIIKFNVEVKKDLRNSQLPTLMMLAKKYPPLLVIANTIFPKLKEELRINNIAYLETNGNVYIKQKKVFLWIDTKKTIPEIKEGRNRVFTRTGLKVIFMLLQDEHNVNLTYREMAKRTGVALGNINYIIHGLIDMGFLIKLNTKQYKLVNKKTLLDKWIDAYGEKLKASITIGRFRFLKEEDFFQWKKLNLKQGKTFWGGEPAADLITRHLNPQELTMYTSETRNELMKHYRLVPDVNGNIIICQKFWQYDEVSDNIVPPLLVYTDLLNTNDHRCIETARIVYEELLEDKFE